MRPSLPVLLPLLLATFLAIAHADNTASAPEPSVEEATSSPPPPPPPSWAPLYPSPLPPPAWAPASAPPPPPPAWAPVSTPSPPTPVSTAVSPPPSPPPSSTSVSPPPSSPAAWTPVADVKGNTIQQVGKFAVRIYALIWQVELVFVDVISGDTKPGQPYEGGYNYRLVVSADSPDAKSAQYDAVVWGIVGTTSWELRSFEPK